MKKTYSYTLLLHIIGCISFFLLPLIFFPHLSSASDILSNPPTQRDFISQLLLIIFFYFNYFSLIPQFYFTKKYFIFYGCIAAWFVFVLLLPFLLTHHYPFNFNHRPPPPQTGFNNYPPNSFNNLNHPPPKPNGQPPSKQNDDFPFLGEAGHTIFLFFVVFFFSLSLKINNRLNKVQQEKTDAGLSYLKSQINPHFLFNTLNLIYSLVIRKSEEAAEAIVKLSNMMRYVLYESNKNFVSLVSELVYIESYIDLQQTRFGKSLNIIYEVKGETKSGKKIAPLILIPFVENAFKHGVNAEENTAIIINIQLSKQELIMNVSNNKVSTTDLDKTEGGVGIANTTNRLQLLYANNYELHIEDNEQHYTVFLKLHLYD